MGLNVAWASTCGFRNVDELGAVDVEDPRAAGVDELALYAPITHVYVPVQ